MTFVGSAAPAIAVRAPTTVPEAPRAPGLGGPLPRRVATPEALRDEVAELALLRALIHNADWLETPHRPSMIWFTSAATRRLWHAVRTQPPVSRTPTTVGEALDAWAEAERRPCRAARVNPALLNEAADVAPDVPGLARRLRTLARARRVRLLLVAALLRLETAEDLEAVLDGLGELLAEVLE